MYYYIHLILIYIYIIMMRHDGTQLTRLAGYKNEMIHCSSDRILDNMEYTFLFLSFVI